VGFTVLCHRFERMRRVAVKAPGKLLTDGGDSIEAG
jgi:hypothetical protein